MTDLEIYKNLGYLKEINNLMAGSHGYNLTVEDIKNYMDEVTNLLMEHIRNKLTLGDSAMLARDEKKEYQF